MDLFQNNGAEFSNSRKYRYALWRIWDDKKPMIMFIGLNPSTANESDDDPTIRRVKRFAYDWGYGGVYMCNCFSYISTNPNYLKDFNTTVTDNAWIYLFAAKCAAKVFAWGNFKIAEERGKELSGFFPEALCLGKNKNGSPKHPLYIAANTKPILFK